MAGEASGRDLLIQRSTDGGTTYNTIASVRTKSVAINNEPIDITTDDSDAWRTLLAEPGNRSIDLSVAGIWTDDDLLAQISAATASVALQDLQIVYPDTSTHEGDFMINTFNVTGEYNGAATFEASFQSSGSVTYTAA